MNAVTGRHCVRAAALLPEAGDLPAPPATVPDRRAALLPTVRWLRREMALRGWQVRDLLMVDELCGKELDR